jgi:hypothetical protein
MEATLKFTAGLLLYRPVRDFLRECEFKGMGIKWIESSGWIERDFTIKGSPDALMTVKLALDKWANDNNLK